MRRSEFQKNHQADLIMGLRSPRLLAAVVVALVGLPLQAQANEMITESEGEPRDEAIASHPLLTPTDQASVPTDEDLENEPAAEAELLIDVSAHPTIQPSTSQAATTVEEWAAQIEASLVQIIDVRVEETEAGLQIVLETAEGELAAPTTQTVGNALITDIPNAVLTLPEGNSYEQFAPAEGIALVSVTNEPGDRVRVAITGTDAPPVAEVNATGLAVTLGVAVAGTDDDAIQVVVTGEGDEGYNPSSASTATRTDTPLRDIPQSIQIVPREVIEDRNTRTVSEIVETVSGVVSGIGNFGTPFVNLTIRGFQQRGNFRNGYRDDNGRGLTGGTNTIEQVEVLKGPASVLFGQIEPGGVVNIVTRQPLNEPYYRLGLEVGSFSFYEPSIDLSGPLTEDDTVLYRLIASYETSDGFQDFVETDLATVAPSLTFNIGERTELNLYYEYLDFNGDPPPTGSALLRDGTPTPRERYLSYPDLASINVETQRVGYTLNHELSDRLQIRSSFAALLNDTQNVELISSGITDDRLLAIDAFDIDRRRDNYFGQIDLLGEFETGEIAHQLLIGFDFNINDGENVLFSDTNLPLLDIFEPNYDIPEPNYQPFFQSSSTAESYGVYIQDQIELRDNLNLLIGGRYDWITSTSDRADFGLFSSSVTRQNDSAFSPRIGLVYQPVDAVSLYTSFSRSFVPTGGTDANGDPFDPTRGTQYEVGVRTDLLDGRLSTNLAAYHLTRSNVTTTDLDNPQFSIQTGEQRSQGVELDVSGEILPGWNIIASYAYTNAEVTEDNDIPVGNRLPNVPEHQASLWTTYEIQDGDFQGLGFGLGLFYVGERQGDINNSFQVDDYLRTDAALYYQRNRFNAAVNIRNLFDINYVRTGFRTTDIELGEPFTIVGSVSWEF